MISPEQIRAKAIRLWSSQVFLRAHLDGRSLFPWDIPFAKPAASEFQERFSDMRAWMNGLRSGSKEILGFGYTITYRAVNHRRLGLQQIPARLSIDTVEDFLRLIGKKKDFQRLDCNAQRTIAEWPALANFVRRHPLMLLTHAEVWEKLLIVCRYFLEHPRPSLYLRQLDVPGVDTKFIETYYALLAELLDEVLPTSAKDMTIPGLTEHGFERRFGLKVPEPLIRFRLLDPSLAISGLTDLTIPLSDFARLTMRPRKIFITENKTNGLSFPSCPEGMVIFGLGYGVQSLITVPWLSKVELFYWGDIDTHGFAILSRLRAGFPLLRSFLMDRPTLERFKKLWVQEDTPSRFTGNLAHLSTEECELFEALRDNRVGERVRLEQERIPFGVVKDTLRSLS